MRLIDADALMNTIALLAHKRKLLDVGYPQVATCVDAAPTIDAVPVVRCKDCKMFNTYNCPMGEFNIANDFCSYGERKEGDTK